MFSTEVHNPLHAHLLALSQMEVILHNINEWLYLYGHVFCVIVLAITKSEQTYPPAPPFFSFSSLFWIRAGYWAVQGWLTHLTLCGIAYVTWLLLLLVHTFFTVEGGDNEFYTANSKGIFGGL